MDHKKALRIVSKRFKYITDKKKYGFFEVWRVMDEDMEGDCEDFALTVLYFICDKSKSKMAKAFLKGDAKIIHLKHSTKGTGHAALKYKGQYTDNITRVWADDLSELKKFGYVKKFTWVAPLVGVKLVVTNLFAKIFG